MEENIFIVKEKESNNKILFEDFMEARKYIKEKKLKNENNSDFFIYVYSYKEFINL